MIGIGVMKNDFRCDAIFLWRRDRHDGVDLRNGHGYDFEYAQSVGGMMTSADVQSIIEIISFLIGGLTIIAFALGIAGGKR